MTAPSVVPGRGTPERKRSLAPLFSAATGKWATPSGVYDDLDREFGFTLDPCPIDDAERIMEFDGLARSWAGERIYCNPPYGRGIGQWLAKAREADVAVFLLPSRTDTSWWHDYAMQAEEIRFIRGRLRFGDAVNAAPFPSVVLVYRRNDASRVDPALAVDRSRSSPDAAAVAPTSSVPSRDAGGADQ